MTENKRFTFSEDVGCLDVPCANIFDNGKFVGTTILSDVEQLCDKLNAFQELSINDLKRIEELGKENEQLKQSLKNKMDSDNYWEQKATEKIKELKEENEQLKKEKEELLDKLLEILNELATKCRHLENIIDEDSLNWIREHTVWEQMPTRTRTYTKTSLGDCDD